MFKKNIKKIVMLVLIIACFVPILNVNAATLKGLRAELQELKDEKQEALTNKGKTEAEINAANREIAAIAQKIEKATRDQDILEAEIKELEIEIKNKQAQIKELVSFFQISESENFYLKYLFGADSFEDFIFRFSVVEQVTTRSDELVKEMNQLITDNNNKIKELDDKKEELKTLTKKVQNKLSELGSQKTKFTELYLDIDLQIKALQNKINTYVKAGCSETEDLSKCTTSVPYDYGFDKPLKKGYVSDEMGMRTSPISGVWKMHYGIDLAGNTEGTAVYSPAAGKVADVINANKSKKTCGGNILVINHIVNGKYYTTRYLHLLTINVKEGQIVSKGEKIATVGGGKATSSWESCSTGAHLHFEVATGHWYGSDPTYGYSSYSTYLKKVINPRNILYFPAYGVRWS